MKELRMGEVAKRRAEAPVKQPGFVLDSSPSYLIGVIANRLVNSGSQLTRRYIGIGFSEWRIVITLALEPGATAQRICQVVGMDKAAVSRGLKELETRGLIAATKETAAKRSRGYVLTKEGQAANNEMIPLSEQRRTRLLKGFKPEEVPVLLDMLHRMLANLPAVEAVEPE